ncbi:MAG: hypothetical protein JNM17_01715 [Archangium sp.]|nr:hypothetical protein [Archangium sp.]
MASVALVGCVSFPSAHLVIDATERETFAAPVVCGPMGFRKSPLQSRWGEYVRVTVGSSSVLRGSAFVHANGASGEPRTWTTAEGNLVIEARFENMDPDARYALLRDRPIDVTITNLEAVNGGTCEGAVFTVEQGELIPNIDERQWIAELERRGGSELAERREALRIERDARRQAHYAAWEARGATLVADVAVREAHYAAWEARRAPVAAVLAVQTPSPAPAGEGWGEGEISSSALVSGETCAVGTSVSSCGADANASAVTHTTITGSTIISGGCVSCGVVGSASGGVAHGTVGGSASGVVANSTVVSGGCATCGTVSASGAVANTTIANSTIVSGGTVGGSASGAVANSAIVSGGCATCGATVVTNTASTGIDANATVGTGDVYARGVLVEAPPSSIEWTAYPSTARSQPTTASVEWTAYPAPPVAVTVEAYPAPIPQPVCDESCQAANTLGFLIPAVFDVFLNMPAPQPPPSRVVKAVPLGSSR